MALCDQFIGSCCLIRIIDNRSEYCIVIAVGTVQYQRDRIGYIYIPFPDMPYSALLIEVLRNNRLTDRDITNR